MCDWACEIYRTSVLACLARGRANLHNFRLTPSGTEISSQVSDAGVTNLREMSLSLRSSLAPEQGRHATPGLLHNTSQEFWANWALRGTDPNALADLEDTYHWRRWITNENDLRPWVQTATVRHANQVELSSLQMTMPEEISSLQACLRMCFPTIPVKDGARKLLIALQDGDLAVSTSVRMYPGQGNRLNDSFCRAKVLIHCRSRLRPEDWQISRQLLCLLCNEQSMEVLARIAELNPTVIEWTSSEEIGFESVVQAISRLHLVGGMQSAGLALTRLPLCLKVATNTFGSSRCEWATSSPQRDGGISADEMDDMVSQVVSGRDEPIPDHLIPYVEKQRLSYIVPVNHGAQEELFGSLRLPSFSTQGILIKKPKDGWPRKMQEFCLLVMNENVHFDDEFRLSQLLEFAKDRREIFGVYKKVRKKVIVTTISLIDGFGF